MGLRSTTAQPLSTLFIDAAQKISHWSNIFERDAKFVSVTDRFHREIHEGEAFSVCHIFENVGDDDSVNILIQTGSSKELHLTVSPAASGEAFAYLYEDTPATGGISLTPRNRLRASSETSDATFTHTPAVDSVFGTLLACELLPGGFGGLAVGATGGGNREEIVLKINTKYLVQLTNKAGQGKNLGIVCSWYEEPPL